MYLTTAIWRTGMMGRGRQGVTRESCSRDGSLEEPSGRSHTAHSTPPQLHSRKNTFLKVCNQTGVQEGGRKNQERLGDELQPLPLLPPRFLPSSSKPKLLDNGAIVQSSIVLNFWLGNLRTKLEVGTGDQGLFYSLLFLFIRLTICLSGSSLKNLRR